MGRVAVPYEDVTRMGTRDVWLCPMRMSPGWGRRTCGRAPQGCHQDGDMGCVAVHREDVTRVGTWDVWPCPVLWAKLRCGTLPRRAGCCHGRSGTAGCSSQVAVAPHGTLGKSFNLSAPPPRRHYDGARRMDAQGRGQDSWFEAGKPWDPHWIQTGTVRRQPGLPSSRPAPSGAPAVGAGCGPSSLPGWLCGGPEPPAQPCLGNIWQGSHWPGEAWMPLKPPCA